VFFQTQILRSMLPWARSRGVAIEPLLERYQLPLDTEDREEVSIAVGALLELVEALAAAAADPWFGLHAATRVPRGAYGLLEFSCRCAPTLHGAVERMIRYYALLNRWEVIRFVEADRHAIIEQHNPHVPPGTGRHANEFFLGLLVLTARAFTGTAFVPLRAWFTHPAPPDTRELAEVLGTDALEFDRPTNGLAVAAAELARPILSADGELLAVLDRAAAQQIKLARQDSTGALVAQFVYRTLQAGNPVELADACAALDTHPRKLQRNLADEGRSFGDIVDSVRLDLARIFLLEDRGSLETLAAELGYSDLRAFLRAFQRWTGGPPSEFRRSHER
jgi:AraC-like DNA-binding protein